MSVAHSALPTYNAALNRPAYQSSVFVSSLGYGSFNASLANDGIRETDAMKDNKARCSISQHETNPWWAVDLGRPTAIYRVDLTNIGGFGVQSGGMYLFCLELLLRFSYYLLLLILYVGDVSDRSFLRASDY